MRVSEGKSIDDILASIMEGRSDQPEIFETLKNVAGDHRSTKDLLAESKPAEPEVPAAKEEPEQQFLCPVCDTAVHPDEKVCRGGGAVSAGGDPAKYEARISSAPPPAAETHRPGGGAPSVGDGAPPPAPPPAPHRPAPPPPPPAAPAAVRTLRLGIDARVAALRGEVRMQRHDLPFGDRKLIARELPRLVNEVKPLLVSAKRIGVGIDEGKRLIAGAVEAGKRKEMEKAVRLISDARRSLDLAFVEYIGSRFEAFASEVEAAGPGQAAALARPLLEGSLAKLEQHNYDGAWDSFQSARHAFASQAKEYLEGRKILDSTEHLMAEVRGLGMDTREVERLLRQGREAADRRDLPGSLRFARQSQERLLQAVPEFVQAEMREARNALLEMKVHGSDLSKPVGILKEASAHVKNEEWSEAIRFLKEFQKETSRAARA